MHTPLPPARSSWWRPRAGLRTRTWSCEQAWQRALIGIRCMGAASCEQQHLAPKLCGGSNHRRPTDGRVTVQAPEEGLRLHVLANLLQQEAAVCRHICLQGLEVQGKPTSICGGSAMHMSMLQCFTPSGQEHPRMVISLGHCKPLLTCANSNATAPGPYCDRCAVCSTASALSAPGIMLRADAGCEHGNTRRRALQSTQPHLLCMADDCVDAVRRLLRRLCMVHRIRLTRSNVEL